MDVLHDDHERRLATEVFKGRVHGFEQLAAVDALRRLASGVGGRATPRHDPTLAGDACRSSPAPAPATRHRGGRRAR
ncbi:MAG: hypothetical protein WKF58_20455 [Ilumatobacteraceae bacterium]